MKRKTLYFILFPLALAASTNAKQSWEFEGPYFANINDYAVATSGGQVTLYAAAQNPVDFDDDAIVLKSTDEGESWNKLVVDSFTGKNVTSVATLISDPSIVYAGIKGVGVYKSTNDGSSWVETDEVDNTQQGDYRAREWIE